MLVFLAAWTFNLVHGLLRGNDAYDALREFRNEAYTVLVYFMTVTIFHNRSDVFRFFKLGYAIAVVIGVYGIIRYTLGIGKDFMDYLIVFYDIADSMVLYMAMILLASAAIEGIKTTSMKLLAVGSLIPIVLTFLLCYRRGAWIGCVAGLVFLIMFYPANPRLRRLFFRRVLVVALIAVVIIAVIPSLRDSGFDFVVARIYSIFDLTEDPSNVFRILDALNALITFAHHPIFGVGAGGRYDLDYLPEDLVTLEFIEHVSKTSHNGYLYVLYKTGIVGFAVFMGVFAKLIKSWFRVRKARMVPSDRAAFMAIGAMLVAVLVTNVTEPLTDLPRTSLLLAFVMGWIGVFIRSFNAVSDCSVG